MDHVYTHIIYYTLTLFACLKTSYYICYFIASFTFMQFNAMRVCIRIGVLVLT